MFKHKMSRRIRRRVMGQIHDREATTRVEFDENGDNGLVIGDKYLPEELLAEIFTQMDYDTLRICQLVCKRWSMIIQSYVWRKKAELVLGKPFPPYKDMPWSSYYFICTKRPFERNLLKNHSGQKGVRKHWQMLNQGGDGWKIESSPVGTPELPDDPVFEGKQTCFVTSFQNCSKMQTIDLQEEGLTSYIADVIQPPIVVSEWYSARFDCPAIYEFSVRLLGSENNVLKEFAFRDSMDGERQYKWFHVSHEFKDYGPGLRKITFYHSGHDGYFWKGHYGSKMAGACVCIKVPDARQAKDAFSPLLE